MNCLFFRVICSNHEWIAHVTLFQRVMRVISLICSCQFVVKRDKSNLLTAILFKRVMRVIQSLSLEWQEQITLSLSLKWAILKERAKSEEQKSKFPTLGFKSWNPCSTTQYKYFFRSPLEVTSLLVTFLFLNWNWNGRLLFQSNFFHCFSHSCNLCYLLHFVLKRIFF